MLPNMINFTLLTVLQVFLDILILKGNKFIMMEVI